MSNVARPACSPRQARLRDVLGVNGWESGSLGPVLAQPGSLTLGKSLPPSVPEFPCLKNGTMVPAAPPL